MFKDVIDDSHYHECPGQAEEHGWQGRDSYEAGGCSQTAARQDHARCRRLSLTGQPAGFAEQVVDTPVKLITKGLELAVSHRRTADASHQLDTVGDGCHRRA